MTEDKPKRSPFPFLFWLVVFFEFVERGCYYGLMSFLSDYMTNELHFAKQDVGVIKATIQPLLYFLPIISGALADRFGYRWTLMVAFTLLGGGYYLTSQATDYTWVFLALAVMGLGAGTFKPLISGTIARCTDATNSTMGFGIYYWSINLGAFLFPLILVSWLKNTVGEQWVIIASAIGTGAMLFPTLLFFKDPPAPKEAPKKERASLLMTLAGAFEIIYSPFVLLYHLAGRSAGRLILVVLFAGLFGAGGYAFFRPQTVEHIFSARTYGPREGPLLVVRVERNLGQKVPFKVARDKARGDIRLTLHDPDRLARDEAKILAALSAHPSARWASGSDLRRFVKESERRTVLAVTVDTSLSQRYHLTEEGPGRHRLVVRGSDACREGIEGLERQLRARKDLAGLTTEEIGTLLSKVNERPFLLLFGGLMLLSSMLALRFSRRFAALSGGGKLALLLLVLGAAEGPIWGLFFMGNLSLFAAILCSIIAASASSLLIIDSHDVDAFKDHFRFLLMIFIYSGFWVLYFQMFDSVLWYVKAYVDASSLDSMVNGLLSALGLSIAFRFDVEHVTVINAGTIILLQLIVSSIVKNTRAMPTMMAGIGLGTLGMAILAFSTGIWVFMAGIVIFSIGEMTGHPKFISYVGQTAPKARSAMYMGYIFLYGVIGSSIGSVVGANLYVKFVDQLNQPRTLWLIFAGIGVATIVCLLIYNSFLKRSGKGEQVR